MSDLWFTPDYIVEPFRELLGGPIDLDPASCAEANEVIRAAKYYTDADNGLVQPWSGNGFVNAPFSKMHQFVEKGLGELEIGHVESLLWLTNANTEVGWYKRLARRANAMCLLHKRIKFWLPGGECKGSNPRSQALFYFGPKVHEFIERYRHLGMVIPMVGPECRPWLHPSLRIRLYDSVIKCFSIAEDKRILISLAAITSNGLTLERYEVSGPEPEHE